MEKDYSYLIAIWREYKMKCKFSEDGECKYSESDVKCAGEYNDKKACPLWSGGLK